MSSIKKITLVCITFIVFFAVLYISGVYALSADSVINPSSGKLINVSTDPKGAIISIIRFFILLTSVLAVMAITWGGIGLILATGDDEKMKKSRKTIIFAFVGVVVAGLAYAIVNTLTLAKIN